MDPNAWQAYQAYTSRLNAGNRDDGGGYSSPSASLLFAHQQLREAANQHYQNQILPPSLVQAAANNKNHLHQQDGNGAFNLQQQPQQQPPPRQSSQLRTHSTPAFPGIAPPQSPGGFSSYSSQTPSPHYGGVTSPSDYERQREKEERRKLEDERRREQDRIRREQERLRQEQEHKRREADRIRKEQEERRRREEYERRKREEHEKKKREEAERRRREEERQRQEQERRRREEERARQEQERLREQERIRVEQERLKQERIKQEEHEQRKLEEQQRDLGLARLGALTALNDLDNQANDMMYNENNMQDQGFQQGINFNDLNMFHNRQNLIKQEDQKPFANSYNPWLNRANELLDLTQQQPGAAANNESRDSPGSQGDEAGLLPGILMNPWDPQQQANMMSLAPIANAMQQYQQQWLTQYQQAATAMNITNPVEGAAAATTETDSYPLGKCKVLCISPDDDMGFLINLPAPCNLLYQPNPTEEECKYRIKKDSPFDITYKKFVKDPDSGGRKDLSDAPEKPPNPFPGQYTSGDGVKTELGVDDPNYFKNTGKKAYIPPYTPKASFKRDDPCANKSSQPHRSSSNRMGGGTPGRPPARQPIKMENGRSSHSGVNRGGGGGSAGNMNKNRGRKVESESEDEEPQYRRETSRRKAKEQSKAKRDAQDSLLLDEDDPTLNNPALDLEDSDVDDEWTPVKEKEGQKGRKADYSSDEDFLQQEISKAKKMMKKRAYPDLADRISNKRISADSSAANAAAADTPDTHRVGDFVLLKTDSMNPTAAIWKIDGKTLIQKYDCIDDKTLEYKNVNTFSGWTQATRAKYEQVEVKHIRQTAKETIVRRIFPPKTAAVNGDQAAEGGVALPAGTEAVPAGTSAASAPAPAAVPDQKVNLDEVKTKSRGETGQFQENFEVYIQTLISQCLDTNFLNEIFADQDDYFVSNIEKVDSVTLLRKDILLNKTSLNMGFQHSLSVWPCLKDVGPETCNDAVCSSCETIKASTMVQLYGQPYHPNTLCPMQPDDSAIMNRNFPVCPGCAAISKLYHRLHHQKHRLYMDCSLVVEERKNADINNDTTKILNQLLADDVWLEQQFKVMQELWADADAFQY